MSGSYFSYEQHEVTPGAQQYTIGIYGTLNLARTFWGPLSDVRDVVNRWVWRRKTWL